MKLHRGVCRVIVVDIFRPRGSPRGTTERKQGANAADKGLWASTAGKQWAVCGKTGSDNRAVGFDDGEHVGVGFAVCRQSSALVLLNQLVDTNSTSCKLMIESSRL